MPDSRTRFILFAVLSSVLSSVATLFQGQGVRNLPPVLAASVGLLFASSLTFCYLAYTKQLPSLNKLKSIVSPLIKLALCRSVFSNIIFTVGLTMSTGVEAVFLTKMEPYLVIFWVWVLDRKRPSSNHLFLLLVHVFGAILLAVGDRGLEDGVSWFGDLLIISGVVTSALSYRFAPQVTKVLTPLQTASVAELIGAAITLPFALFFFSFEFGPEQQLG